VRSIFLLAEQNIWAKFPGWCSAGAHPSGPCGTRWYERAAYNQRGLPSDAVAPAPAVMGPPKLEGVARRR
jgi:hypothetical protein